MPATRARDGRPDQPPATTFLADAKPGKKDRVRFAELVRLESATIRGGARDDGCVTSPRRFDERRDRDPAKDSPRVVAAAAGDDDAADAVATAAAAATEDAEPKDAAGGKKPVGVFSACKKFVTKTASYAGEKDRDAPRASSIAVPATPSAKKATTSRRAAARLLACASETLPGGPSRGARAGSPPPPARRRPRRASESVGGAVSGGPSRASTRPTLRPAAAAVVDVAAEEEEEVEEEEEEEEEGDGSGFGPEAPPWVERDGADAVNLYVSGATSISAALLAIDETHRTPARTRESKTGRRAAPLSKQSSSEALAPRDDTSARKSPPSLLTPRTPGDHPAGDVKSSMPTWTSDAAAPARRVDDGAGGARAERATPPPPPPAPAEDDLDIGVAAGGMHDDRDFLRILMENEIIENESEDSGSDLRDTAPPFDTLEDVVVDVDVGGYFATRDVVFDPPGYDFAMMHLLETAAMS